MLDATYCDFSRVDFEKEVEREKKKAPLPDNAEGFSFAIGSGENAVRLEEVLWGAKELLSTFGLRKNLFR